ncbi:MAG: type transport system ATP-binding protein [Kribbellaceae bacterium]|nr:type transport system ATP-binding protein [Kribbellaceae bacterium]
MTGLTLTGLTKQYDGVPAVAGAHHTARAGAVHGLLGPNGAGKTTLLAMVLGLIRPDSGTMTLNDAPLAGVRGAVPGGVAGCVEEPRFYPYLSGMKNLEVVARLDDEGGMPPAEALDRVGLGDRARTKVGAYSMGMRQRLAIASCLIRRPRLLILDEPTSGLDPASASDLLGLLRELATDGRSVLVSSHDLAAVDDLCDDATVMRAGEVVVQASMAELRASAPAPSYRLRTSDDVAALRVAAELPDVVAVDEGPDLEVSAEQPALDALVLALADKGIAVRRLETRQPALRLLFDKLTAA